MANMRDPDRFLLKRGKRWYYQRRVPGQFSHLDQRRFAKVSLKTDSLEIARLRRDHLAEADDEYWMALAVELAEENANAPFSCVMHCFSSSAELAKAALDLGFYLSMSGIAAFPKSQELRDIFAAAPVDRILVETDAPYLAPPPYRGKRNEPAYVAHTAAAAAAYFGMSAEAFAAQTEENFERLFTKAKLPEAAL